MAVILFDQPDIRTHLLPFTFTRPVSEIRVGIFKISEKWERRLNEKIGWITESYLSEGFPYISNVENIYVNGAICPDATLLAAINSLEGDTALVKGLQLIAFKSSIAPTYANIYSTQFEKSAEYQGDVTLIDRTWKIFQSNGSQIAADIDLVKNTANNAIDDPHTRVYHPENIFIEKGVNIKAAILNAENGYIYLGKNSEIKEGAIIRGPFALGESSVVKMGAKIVGDTTIGPYSKVGGEISNSVIFGCSNKAHDGFLGNSVIGEWCNLGADTNTSNLKNNYQKVKLWDYETKNFENTELQFCGLIMGDHSKCGINTMFNTGTVMGVGANVFGEGFPPNFIPSFSWGGSKGFGTFQFDKFLEMTKVVMERRSREFTDLDKSVLESVFKVTAEFRNWEV